MTPSAIDGKEGVSGSSPEEGLVGVQSVGGQASGRDWIAGGPEEVPERRLAPCGHVIPRGSTVVTTAIRLRAGYMP